MPTRRSSKEDREGGRKSAGCSISSGGHKAGSRRFGEMVALASRDPGEQSPLLPPESAKGSGMEGTLPPSLPDPQRAPHKPPAEAAALGAAVPRPFLQLLAASRLLSPSTASA